MKRPTTKQVIRLMVKQQFLNGLNAPDALQSARIELGIASKTKSPRYAYFLRASKYFIDYKEEVRNKLCLLWSAIEKGINN